MKYHKLIIVAGLSMSLAHLSLGTESTLTVGKSEMITQCSEASELSLSLERCVAYDMSLTGRAKRLFKAAVNALIAGPQPNFTGPLQTLTSSPIELQDSLEKFDN